MPLTIDIIAWLMASGLGLAVKASHGWIAGTCIALLIAALASLDRT